MYELFGRAALRGVAPGNHDIYIACVLRLGALSPLDTTTLRQQIETNLEVDKP